MGGMVFEGNEKVIDETPVGLGKTPVDVDQYETKQKNRKKITGDPMTTTLPLSTTRFQGPCPKISTDF